jgi:hypothetical protein
MSEEPFPYNLPPWRRKYEQQSPDGKYTATIYEAWELFMSGPTYGKLFVGDMFRIEKCSPTFVWSDDSRYLAVPQWGGAWLLRSERLLILDAMEKKIFVSNNKYKLIIVNSFTDGIISLTESPLKKTKEISISLEEVARNYKISTALIQGTPSQRPSND